MLISSGTAPSCLEKCAGGVREAEKCKERLRQSSFSFIAGVLEFSDTEFYHTHYSEAVSASERAI